MGALTSRPSRKLCETDQPSDQQTDMSFSRFLVLFNSTCDTLHENDRIGQSYKWYRYKVYRLQMILPIITNGIGKKELCFQPFLGEPSHFHNFVRSMGLVC